MPIPALFIQESKAIPSQFCVHTDILNQPSHLRTDILNQPSHLHRAPSILNARQPLPPVRTTYIHPTYIPIQTLQLSQTPSSLLRNCFTYSHKTIPAAVCTFKLLVTPT